MIVFHHSVAHRVGAQQNVLYILAMLSDMVTHSQILRWRGLETYETSFAAMRIFTEARTSNTVDEIWLVEHAPVFTLGQAGNSEHLLVTDSRIPLVKTDRGGQITYHGPGQVVAYLLLDLRRRKLMIRELILRIEQAVIDTLISYKITGVRKAGAPGIYIAPNPITAHTGAKIAALGLKIRNGCSYHGLSLNVDMNLQPFLSINPCGYTQLATVDMATLGATVTWNDVATTLARNLTINFDNISVPPLNYHRSMPPSFDWTEND